MQLKGGAVSSRGWRGRWRASVASVVAGLVPMISGSLRAQSAPLASDSTRQTGTYTIVGAITGLDGAVANADVLIAAAGTAPRSVRSDSAGNFTVSGLPSAELSIRVRAFGYQPRTLAVRVRGAGNVEHVTIALEPVVAELAGVNVFDRGGGGDRKLDEYYKRKARNGFAHFVDGSVFDERKPRFPSEVLRSVPGVVVSARGRVGNMVTIRGCSPLVWVDGVRLPGAQLDEVVSPDDIAAVEIYNSFAGIPAPYFDRTAACGTILVWLRS